VVNESVTKTETKEIKEEVLEQGVGGGSDETIDTISQESQGSQKNIFVIIGETVARVVETILPFLKNEPSAGESPKVADLIIHSLVGAVSPPLNMVRIFQEGLKAQFAFKPRTKDKPVVTPQPSTIPSSFDSKTIDNTRKNLDISPKKFEGLMINDNLLKKQLISQYPNDTRSHENDSAIDFALPDKTPIKATMDGTVTLKIDNIGKGQNTWIFRDNDGNKIPYYNSSGNVYYKCEAKQDDFNNEVCGKWVYGISATLENFQDSGKKYKVVYAHLSRTTFDNLKDKTNINSGVSFEVKKGDLIGFTDNAGYSSGPHLHYEVWINDKSIITGDSSEIDKCLKDTNQTIEAVLKYGRNNICWEKLYNYNKLNLKLMGIDLDSIPN
jgi:hypothetical protein